MIINEFNQGIESSKKAGTQEAVFITDRGHVSQVLLTIDAYLKLTGMKGKIVDLLAMPVDLGFASGISTLSTQTTFQFR